MASGWARDGAEQEQIDATIYDAIAKARQGLSDDEDGEAALYCEECGEPIPQARRETMKGVKYCIRCQQQLEEKSKALELFNRRGSKDSQLR